MSEITNKDEFHIFSSAYFSAAVNRSQYVKDEKKEIILAKAKKEENVLKHLNGKEIIKEIVIPNKIVNIVIK